MAETPLARKLQIKSGYRVAILNAPEGYREYLGTLPAGVELVDTLEGAPDVVHLFVRDSAQLQEHAAAALRTLKEGGLLWISYPKQSSKVPTDLSRDKNWEVLRAAGWRPVTQISVDEVWSALRFRPGPWPDR